MGTITDAKVAAAQVIHRFSLIDTSRVCLALSS
jgi:hypothetical protein